MFKIVKRSQIFGAVHTQAYFNAELEWESEIGLCNAPTHAYWKCVHFVFKFLFLQTILVFGISQYFEPMTR